MVASEQVEVPWCKGNGPHLARHGSPAQVIGRKSFPILRKNVVPGAKRVGCDLLEFAEPEYAEVLTLRMKFQSAAKKTGRQTLWEQPRSVASRGESI